MLYKNFLLVIALLICFVTDAQCQLDANLTTVDGHNIAMNDVVTPEKPSIILFCNMNDFLSIQDELQEIYDDSLIPVGNKLVVVLTNNNGMWQQVKPALFGRNYQLNVYIDLNNQLSRNMGIPTSYATTCLYDPVTGTLTNSGFYSPELLLEEIMKILTINYLLTNKTN